MLRLYPEQEANERAFTALTRFLDALDDLPPRPARAALDPLALSFQLKLLWLSGYLPHLEACVECGVEEGLVGFLPAAGGAVCQADALPGTIALSHVKVLDFGLAGLRGIRGLLHAPLADATALGLGERATRDALAVVTTSYEHHGGFRLRTLSA